MVSRLVLITLIATLVAACAATAPPAPAPAPQQPPATGKTAPGASTASLGLLDQARQARLGGHERAAGLLQRAQRVQPGNARVYLELSRLYRDQGDVQAARHVAERGLLYCEGAICTQLQEEL